jgi:hypothetical protein
MVLIIISAIFVGSFIGWLFIEPMTEQALWRLYGESDKT